MISVFIIILEYTFNKIPRYSIIVYFHPSTASSTEYHVFTVHKLEEDLCIVLEVGKFERDRMPAEGKTVEKDRMPVEVQGKTVEKDSMPVEGKMVVLDRMPVEVQGKMVVLDKMPVEVQDKMVVLDRMPAEGQDKMVVLDKMPVEGRIVEGSAMGVDQGKFVVAGRLLGEGRTRSWDKIECEERQ